MKKKLTSSLSLVLVLSMLLSSVAMATEQAAPTDSSAGSSVSEPAEPTESTESTESTEPTTPAEPQEPTEPTEPSQPMEPTTPAEPVEPTEPTEPTEPVESAEPIEESEPTEMAAAVGWGQDEDENWIYQYTDRDGNTVLAGDPVTYPKGKVQILYVPEQTLTVHHAITTCEAGFYVFSEGIWQKDYATSDKTTFKNIVEIELVAGHYARQKQAEDCQYDGNRLMTFQDGVGTLFNGRRKEKCSAEKNKSLYRRYDDGQPRKGFGLGSDNKLYYYSDGFYQTSASLKQLKKNDGYHQYSEDGKDTKLYYATTDSLEKYNAPVFTGRWTDSNNVKRRYEKGVPYNGFGLGTGSTPNLYYYVDGLYQKTTDKTGAVIYDGVKSKDELEAYLGDGKVWTNGKRYVASESTLVGTKTQPYAKALTGYRMVSGKMYKYTKGTGVLFTGFYTGTEANLQQYQGKYFSKGVQTTIPNGWYTTGGKRYYIKNGKPVTGWNYIKYNGVTYYYYFNKDGSLVTDLFTHFGSSYKSKKMRVQINRSTHTADILLYNSKTKAYDIPAKSFVASTPVLAKDFKSGTYSLSYTRRWWSFKNPETGKTSYFQYGIRIAGTPAALIHSSSYSAKKENKLNVGNYNKLGTNQSYYCIRFQCGNSKLVYDCVKKQGSKKVQCRFYSSSSKKGPYGQIKLSDTTGKLKSGTKYDPTDPAAKK